MQSNPAVPVLQIGYSAVPPGHVAAIVTSLEMLGPPPQRPARPLPPELALQPLVRDDPELYRRLFRDVGAEWLWFSRLTLSEDALTAILADARVEIFALRQGGQNVGILELDFRQPETCELVYFGLAAPAIGKGIGRTLMNEAIARAWSRPIKRFWLHTCTLDHPGAVDFYRRSGFTPCAVQVEVAPDPRLTGILPRDCAPQVPLLG